MYHTVDAVGRMHTSSSRVGLCIDLGRSDHGCRWSFTADADVVGLDSMKGLPLKGAVYAWSLRRWNGPYMTTYEETKRERGSMGASSALNGIREKEEAEESKPPPNRSNGRRRSCGCGSECREDCQDLRMASIGAGFLRFVIKTIKT
jgi:hypothetical protein